MKFIIKIQERVYINDQDLATRVHYLSRVKSPRLLSRSCNDPVLFPEEFIPR